MIIKITYISLLCVLLSACQEQNSPQPSPNLQRSPVAQVGMQSIYKEDVDAELHDLPSHLQHLSQNPQARQQVLKTLIRRAALSQQAVTLGLEQDPIIHRRIKRSRDSILIAALQDWEISQLPTPDKKSIQAYYQHHLDHFTIAEQIHARHILVRKKSEALNILKQLKHHKDDFASLAAHYSIDDSNKSRGGDLNWFPRGTMVTAFEKVAFALKHLGDISRPVESQYGWHIIELLGKRPAYTQTLAESSEEILQILRQQALDRWMDKLVQENHATIFNTPASEPTLQLPINQP